MNQWYVVYTHARSEKQALTNLHRQGFSAYLPLHLKRRRHARRIDWVPSPLFPRYLFVEMDIKRTCWHVINSTIGVIRLFTQGHLPTPVPTGIVEDIQTHEDETGMVVLNPAHSLKKGDMVRITAGAMYDHIGFFDCTDDNKRVVILLNLLGREVKVRLPATTISACA